MDGKRTCEHAGERQWLTEKLHQHQHAELSFSRLLKQVLTTSVPISSWKKELEFHQLNYHRKLLHQLQYLPELSSIGVRTYVLSMHGMIVVLICASLLLLPCCMNVANSDVTAQISIVLPNRINIAKLKFNFLLLIVKNMFLIFKNEVNILKERQKTKQTT